MDIEIILQIRQEMGATKKSKLNGFVLLKLSSKKSLNECRRVKNEPTIDLSSGDYLVISGPNGSSIIALQN